MINSDKGVPTPLALTIIIFLAVILVGGVFTYQYLIKKEGNPPEGTISASDLQNNFKEYLGEQVSIYVRGFGAHVYSEKPFEWESATCKLSSRLPIECCGLWRYNYFGEGEEDNITFLMLSIFTGETVDNSQIVGGKLIANCFVNTKTAHNCKFIDNSCECDTDSGLRNYNFTPLIVTNSALNKLKNSVDNGCLFYYDNLLNKEAVEGY